MLVEGDHFGEISLLYDCPRTASIRARNYNTMAILSKKYFNDLTYIYPYYKNLLKKQIYKYNDPYKQFLKKIVRRVEYLKNLTTEQFHDFIYTLKSQ